MNWSNLSLTRQNRDEMFIAAGWWDVMKNNGGMRDWKSLFWTLIVTLRKLLGSKIWFNECYYSLIS